ncbi:MAG: DnaB-like helicase C-terminal domain-containing protein [Myxococcota bacterium]
MSRALVEQDGVDLHSVDLEHGLLGDIVETEGRILAALEDAGLRAGHFYRTGHGRLYSALSDRHRRGLPVDYESIGVWSTTLTDGQADAYGGRETIAQLGRYRDRAHLAVPHALQVIELAQRREARDLGLKIARMAADTQIDAATMLAEVERRTVALSNSRARPSEWTTGPVLARRALTAIQARAKAREAGEALGLSWGVPELADKIPPLRARKLYLLAARPGMGKSSFALGVARSALKAGSSVGIFSLEMDGESIADKLIALEADFPTARLRDGDIGADWADVRQAAESLAGWPIYLDDRAGVTIDQIKSRARSLSMECARTGQPLGLLVIDYAQLIEAPGYTGEAAIARVSTGLLMLAKELNVPVLALAQLNRKCEDRANKRPQKSDLRNSGQFEQDAHAILLLYRDHEYNPATADPHDAEVIVDKFRDGRTGIYAVSWDPSTQRFGGPRRQAAWRSAYGGHR